VAFAGERSTNSVSSSSKVASPMTVTEMLCVVPPAGKVSVRATSWE
jgi:hypothetical protein